MEFLQRYFRNLAVIALVAAGAWALLKIFFPALLDQFTRLGSFFGGFGMWPVLVFLLLILAIPLRRP